MEEPMTKRLCLAVSVVVLAACANNVGPGQPLPQLTFAQLQPIPVNVSTINTHIRGSKTGGAFIADPAAVAENYMKARFVPRGAQGSLDATIEEATVTKDEKESANNVARFLKVGGTDVYNITLRVRFEHLGAGGLPLYGKVFTARRRLNISEHDSIAEREKFEFKSLEKMFNELDKEVIHMVTEDMRIRM
jgi:hypothetical protein